MTYSANFSSFGILILGLFAACGGSNHQTDTSSQDAAEDTVAFKKYTLTTDFISEGVAIGDVNRDGNIDVMAGAYWFAAPEWTRKEIFPGKAFDGAKGYSNSFLNFSMDVNQDDWVDLIVIDFPGTLSYWYENPKNADGHWKKHLVHEAVLVGNESPTLVDVDGDGRLDLLCADSKEKQMVWLKPPSTQGETVWRKFPISEKNAPGTDRFSHGLGFGDINNDGRKDVVIKEGWWEGPDDAKQPGWKFHQADLGADCSQMQVLDVNADGLSDVVSASAHRYGIWWHEQGKDGEGKPTWTQHEISKAFSQSHCTALADINGDDIPDLLVGKRFFAHNDTDHDPGARDPAVLYWYEFTPGEPPYFHPHQIDDNSGSGLNLVAKDMSDDGTIDVAISNKKGVFVFEQTR